VTPKVKWDFRPKTETESQWCHYNASLSEPTVPDADVDSAASFLGYLYIVSQYTVSLMIPCIWRILCLRNSSSVPYFRQPPNLPTAACRNQKCTECGTTACGRNRMSAESAHLSTFCAEAEIRSTSTDSYWRFCCVCIYCLNSSCFNTSDINYSICPSMSLLLLLTQLFSMFSISCWCCCIQTCYSVQFYLFLISTGRAFFVFGWRLTPFFRPDQSLLVTSSLLIWVWSCFTIQ